MIQESLFPTSGMRKVVQGEADLMAWPYRFAHVEDAFDMESDTQGVQLWCAGCKDPLRPYTYGPSGRTSARLRDVMAFLREHVAQEHPAWVVGV